MSNTGDPSNTPGTGTSEAFDDRMAKVTEEYQRMQKAQLELKTHAQKAAVKTDAIRTKLEYNARQLSQTQGQRSKVAAELKRLDEAVVELEREKVPPASRRACSVMRGFRACVPGILNRRSAVMQCVFGSTA